MPLCKLTDCPIAKSGRCLEGRGEECPNLLPEGSTPLESLAPPEVINAESSPTRAATTDLYSGNPITIKEAREFSRNSKTVVVVLVGLIESGKTSLVARLHQQFLMGPVGGYAFAGSRTLLRFEELNWKSTIESGAAAPQMDRTSRLFDNSFLHLRVRPAGDVGSSIDLLLNDVSGETVQEAVGTQDICGQLQALKRADHVVVVADGAALADFSVCFDHAAKLKNFIQRVLQSGQIGQQTVLHLLISKIDKLKAADAAAARLEQDFTRLFGHRVGSLHFWRVAARPTDGTQPTEKEIAKLFSDWITTSLRYPKPDYALVQPADWERDFCRFQVKNDLSSS